MSIETEYLQVSTASFKTYRDLADRIANGGEPMARLMPLAPEAKVERKPGQWEGKIWMSDHFDDPLLPDILAAFYGEDENPEDPGRWPDSEENRQ